jgi:hypothetical protein
MRFRKIIASMVNFKNISSLENQLLKLSEKEAAFFIGLNNNGIFGEKALCITLSQN